MNNYIYRRNHMRMVIDSQSTRTLTKVRNDLDANWSSVGSNSGSFVVRNTRITLTKEESDLFNLLTDVAERYNSETVLRVAGGWVRDKLLAEQHFTMSDDNETATAPEVSKDVFFFSLLSSPRINIFLSFYLYRD